VKKVGKASNTKNKSAVKLQQLSPRKNPSGGAVNRQIRVRIAANHNETLQCDQDR
jgi:hypothetical protein